jgi:hypothetical protein
MKKKLTKKTKVLLALLAQLGPYPDRSEKIFRTKVQIKINRLLVAKNIESELDEREKFLFRALKEYWLRDSVEKNKILNSILIINLKKQINIVENKINNNKKNEFNKGGNVQSNCIK